VTPRPLPAPELRSEPWFDSDGYPFRSRFMELPAIDGGAPARLHYLDEGEGFPVVIVGGTPGWSYEWRYLVRRLQSRFRVIVPDHLGMGLSDRHGDPEYPLSRHRENLEALLDELGIDRSHWVVHDFGGPIALPKVLDRPEAAAGVVVLNSWMWDHESVRPAFRRQRWILGSRAMSWLYRKTNFSPRILMRRSRGRPSAMTKRDLRHYTSPFPNASHRAQLHAFLRALLEEGAAAETAWRNGVPLRDTPTMIVWGLADPLVPPEHLERWRADLPGARIERLEGVGHFPHEESPEEVATVIEAFLASE